MDDRLRKCVCNATGAESILQSQVVQTLWSGYGQILRVSLVGGCADSVIVKHVAPPIGGDSDHPRGWATDLSHQRKLRSYQVESAWYQNWSEHCSEKCRVPQCIDAQDLDGQYLFVLEDLDASGFPMRKSGLEPREAKLCLSWLAEFHATFMGAEPADLWQVGTYWHLATRSEEWETMPGGELKEKAHLIDQALTNCQHRTLVHGDAKVANFCFSDTKFAVAAVDFQYVGGGCGMKDVAYFLGSCLSENSCQRLVTELLDHYFRELRSRLASHHPDVDTSAVEREWRQMFCVAWADFNRFLAGWCPGHHKLTGYSQQQTRQALDLL